MGRAFIVAVIALIIGIRSAVACADSNHIAGTGYESATYYGESFIEPSFLQDRYIRNEDRLYLRNRLEKSGQELEAASLEEWVGFFKASRNVVVDVGEIKKCLAGDSAALERLSAKTGLNMPGEDNKALLQYFDVWVKHRLIEDRWWDKKKMVYDGGVLQFLVQKAVNPKFDEFTRAKFALLAVRYCVMTQQYGKSIEQFNKLMSPLKYQGITRYRAMGYVARAHRRIGQKKQALTAYLRIFDECVPLRMGTLASIFRLGWGKDLYELARDIQNPHKKLCAYYLGQMSLERDYSKEFVEALVRYGENESQAEFGLVRVLQDIEADRSAEKSNNLKEIIGILEGATAKKMRHPDLWLFAVSYASFMAGDLTKAWLYCKKAENEVSVGEEMKRQLHLLRTLMMLEGINKEIPVDVQNHVLTDLRWLETNRESLNSKAVSRNLLEKLSEIYYGKKDVLRRLLYAEVGHNDVHVLRKLTAEELALLDKMLYGENLSPLEKFAVNKSRIRHSDLQIPLLEREIATEKFDDAIIRYGVIRTLEDKEQVRPDKGGGIYYRPLDRSCTVYVDRNDETSTEVSKLNVPVSPKWVRRLEGEGVGYVKLTLEQFLSYMRRLQKRSLKSIGITEKQRCRALYEMARAYVSSDRMGTYYSACHCVDYKRQNRAFNAPSNCQLARDKFEQIIQSGADPELSAKSLVYLHFIHAGSSWVPTGDCGGDYVVRLKAKFQSTRFYQEYKTRCAALRDVVTPQTTP